MNIKEFVSEFAEKGKYFISYYENFKNMTGAEKKACVDAQMLLWAEKALNLLKINAVIKFIIKKGLEKYLPAVTQAVFDLIKARINGITDKAA